jgi:hypothetical protein
LDRAGFLAGSHEESDYLAWLNRLLEERETEREREGERELHAT